MHCSALGSFFKLQVPHVHKEASWVGAFIPAAAQLKDCVAGLVEEDEPVNVYVGSWVASKASAAAIAGFESPSRPPCTGKSNDGSNA